MPKRKLKNQIIEVPTAQKSEEIKYKFAGAETPSNSRTRTKSACSSRIKSSPIDYYQCLINYAQQGFYDVETGQKQKIHSCCKKCKLKSPTLNQQRNSELVKLITSYKQVGDSLAKLLKPIPIA